MSINIQYGDVKDITIYSPLAYPTSEGRRCYRLVEFTFADGTKHVIVAYGAGENISVVTEIEIPDENSD